MRDERKKINMKGNVGLKYFGGSEKIVAGCGIGLACEKYRHTERSGKTVCILHLDQQTSRRRKEKWLVFSTFQLLVRVMSYLVVANGGEYLFGVCCTL